MKNFAYPELKNFCVKLFESVDFRRIKWRELLAGAVIAAISGVIIIPSVGKCVENDKKNHCNSAMYIIMEKLSSHLAAESADGEWHNMILNGESDKALEMLVGEAAGENKMKIDSSSYYFEKRGNTLYLRCGEHPELKDRNILLANVPPEEEKDFGTLGWNSNTNRRIADVTTLGGSSFIIDAGQQGKYCVSAWEWADYVAGATAEDGKIYPAAVVHYDGMYYYYPDGFKVINTAANTNPFRYAVDPDSTRQAAYCIPVDTSSVMSGRFSSNSHEGSLMAENEEVYIWQTRPSKAQSKGWIKIECETKKL